MLSKGILKKHINNSVVQDEYTMRLISLDELYSAVELENYVYGQLPNKQVLYVDTYEDMYEDMKSGARIIGVFNGNDEIIAYRYIGFPGKSSKNLAHDIDLCEAQLDKVVHLETTVVHPNYRGNDLQSLTLKHTIPMVRALGYRHLLCTVSPQNLFSLYNIMKNGLKIKALKKKYGSAENQSDGLWRFILHRDLEIGTYEKPIDSFTSKLENIDEQRILIENGYIGFNVLRESGMLNYAKFNSGLLQYQC